MRTEEGILLLNDQGRILWSNSVAAQLLGFSRAELCQLALPLVGSQSPASETALTQRIRMTPIPARAKYAAAPDSSVGPVATSFRALLAGDVTEAEGAARFPDKNEKRIAVHWKLWSLPSNAKEKLVLLSISETAQATPEGPITSSYRDIFEHAVEGIYRATIEGQFLEVNPALARMCGYDSPAEMLDCVRDLDTQYYVRPNRRAEFVMALRQNGSLADFESEVFRADGSVLWIAEFARIVCSQEGDPIYLEGSVIDVSKRKQAETALQLSEEKFRSLVETTRVVPFEFHPATQHFIYIGPQAEAVFQSPIGLKLTWERWLSLLHPEDYKAGCRFGNLPLTELPCDYQTEFRIRTTDGRVIWIKQLVHFARQGDECDALVRGFFFDITEAKKLEVEQENARLQLRELTARLQQIREQERVTIAGEIHDEVGQALTLLKIDLSWMMAYIDDPIPKNSMPKLTERIVLMEEKIESAFATVRGILLTLRPPLLEELGLHDAMDFHLTELAKRVGFRYELDVASESELSNGTKIAIFRIFQEVLTNVARHSKASRVKVCLWESEDKLLMTIVDNGCGFLEEKEQKPKSLGILGMKERASALGGEVDVQGLIGKGTKVTLQIPVERPASRMAVSSPPTAVAFILSNA